MRASPNSDGMGFFRTGLRSKNLRLANGSWSTLKNGGQCNAHVIRLLLLDSTTTAIGVSIYLELLHSNVISRRSSRFLILINQSQTKSRCCGIILEFPYLEEFFCSARIDEQGRRDRSSSERAKSKPGGTTTPLLTIICSVWKIRRNMWRSGRLVRRSKRRTFSSLSKRRTSTSSNG